MITSRDLAVELDKQHSNIKVSIKRALGVKSVKENKFKHNGNLYSEYILTSEQADIVRDRLIKKTTFNQIIEPIAISTIEQLLGVELIKQYSVIGYRIDGYCPLTNTAYEIDEEHHYSHGRLKQECLDRQLEIQSELNCKFVRIKL